jgi:hypothetical protein
MAYSLALVVVSIDIDEDFPGAQRLVDSMTGAFRRCRDRSPSDDGNMNLPLPTSLPCSKVDRLEIFLSFSVLNSSALSSSSRIAFGS